jgi:hypothetical protein
MASTSPGAAVSASSAGSKSYTPALAILATLFFMWGFLTCLNDIIIPHLKAVFELNYMQMMLIQFCFFTAYFVASIPSGAIVERLGQQSRESCPGTYKTYAKQSDEGASSCGIYPAYARRSSYPVAASFG